MPPFWPRLSILSPQMPVLMHNFDPLKLFYPFQPPFWASSDVPRAAHSFHLRSLSQTTPYLEDRLMTPTHSPISNLCSLLSTFPFPLRVLGDLRVKLSAPCLLPSAFCLLLDLAARPVAKCPTIRYTKLPGYQFTKLPIYLSPVHLPPHPFPLFTFYFPLSTPFFPLSSLIR
jgi:hypothetical protein